MKSPPYFTSSLGRDALVVSGAALGTLIVYRSVSKFIKNLRRTVVPSTQRHHILQHGFEGKQVELSRSEKGMYLQSQMFSGSMKVCVSIKLHGPAIAEGDLRRALRLLQRRHPFLRAGVRKVDDTLAFTECEDDVPIIMEPREADDSWVGIWRCHETKQPQEGELLWSVAVVQNQGSDDADIDLLLILDHAICDGVSVLSLSHQLLSILSGDPDRYPYEKPSSSPELSLRIPPSLEGALDDHFKSMGILWPAYWVGSILRLVSRVVMKGRGKNQEVPASIVPDTSVPFLQMSSQCTTQHAFFELAPKDVAVLLARCRAHSTTVTAVLGTAISMALGKIVAPPGRGSGISFRIGLGVDLRPRYRVQVPREDVSYHVGGMSPSLLHFDYKSLTRDFDPVMDRPMFWEQARQMRADMVNRLATGEVHTIGWLIGFLYNQGLTATELPKDRSSFSLSNWGLSEMSEVYGSWDVTGITPVVNLTRINSPAVLCVTTNGHLVVTFLAPSVAFASEDVENLAQWSRDILVQALGC